MKSLMKQCGATMVEYAVMLALIAVVCLAIITQLGTVIDAEFDSVGASLTL